MTIITLAVFAVIAAAGIAATIKTLASDGYRRIPTRRV